jgi:PAS domain S-box-containing protein
MSTNHMGASNVTTEGPDIPGWVWISVATGIAVTWLFDLLTPLGVAGGAPYVLVVLLGLWTRSQGFVWSLTGICFLLNLLGMFFSSPGLGEEIFLVNRIMTSSALILCAGLVTYQIRLRKEYQASIQRERDYLDIAGVMLLGLDDQARITLLNRRGHELLGAAGEKLLGRNWIDEFVPEEIRPAIREMYSESMKGNRELPVSYENEIVIRGGRRRTFKWHNLILRDDQGQLAGVLCSGEDVTTLQSVEENLEASQAALNHTRNELYATEQLMAAVVESAVEGIITIDTDGQILTANPAACGIFRYERDELIGRNVSMLMPPPDREQHDGYLARYVQTGVAGIIGRGREVTALSKGGERIPIHLSISDVRNHTTRVFTGVIRDLTEEKHLQRKLQEQEALAAIGQMAAVVAHEVKNPLAGIAGVIQILRGRYPKETGEHQIMGEVLTRIDALVETLQDLLLYARPRELKLREVPLNDLLAETARMLAVDPRSKDVKIEMPVSQCTLRVDVDYLREALLNIYLNAAQAMNGKGEIHTELSDQGNLCILRITDNGPGIPDEVRARVFEPFFTTKGRGTGLGLALVKRVIERHGGEVRIHCPPAGGTVVTLTLPHSHEPKAT